MRDPRINEVRKPSAVPVAGSFASPPGEHEPLLLTLGDLHGKIGIYGGSFDPPHIAHHACAQTARAGRGLDTVIFMPTAANPFKPGGPVASQHDRIEMLRLMLREDKAMCVSPAQFATGRERYTIDLLEYLRSAVPADARLHLILGSDLLAEFHRWKRFREVPSIAQIIPVNRAGFEPDWRALELTLDAELVAALQPAAVNLAAGDIRSRELRQRIAAGERPVEVPVAVMDYIERQGLYGAGSSR